MPLVRCRQIQDEDLEPTADLLTEGFPDRSRKYWTNGLARMGQRPTPDGFPRYGYVLESGGALVGVLLLLFTGGGEDGTPPRFNVSSWYVRPAYRAHATLMVTMAIKRKQAIYLNTSPAPATLPILHAMGYRLLTAGQFLSAPILSPRGLGARVTRITAETRLPDYPDQAELELLRAHAAAGCIALVCRDAKGWAPLVFMRREIRYSPLGTVQLAYCRDAGDLARFAGAVGLHLLKSGQALVLSDANGPVAGLVGRFFKDKAPKYYRGPSAPRINDLAFTEAVIFGP
jgi:hypothetical protein